MTLDSFAKYVDEQVLSETVYNINQMPGRMIRGLLLVYPERRLDFLDFLIERAAKKNCDYIDNALDIMQALEDGASIEDAALLIADPIGAYAAMVRSVVLAWSKRGPEFFRATLPCSFEELDEETQKGIVLLEQQNAVYEQNAAHKEDEVTLAKKTIEAI